MALSSRGIKPRLFQLLDPAGRIIEGFWRFFSLIRDGAGRSPRRRVFFVGRPIIWFPPKPPASMQVVLYLPSHH